MPTHPPEKKSAEESEVKPNSNGQGALSVDNAEQPESSPTARRLLLDHFDMRRLIQLDACTSCGECLNWCPVYDQDAREAIIPRTKIIDFLKIIKTQQGLFARPLARSEKKTGLVKILRRLLNIREVTEEMMLTFAQNLYECSTCGQCQVVCPANIDTVNLWEDIRRLVVEAGYGPLDSQKILVKSVKSYDNPWQQPRQARTKWARRAKKDNLIPALPRDIKKTEAKILLFFGCTAVYNANVWQIAINTVNILEKLDIDYGCLGGDEKCCGSVMLRMGDSEFGRIASDNINMFNSLGIDLLVTSCAGCFKTIKEDYAQVAPMNFEVLHIVEYLQGLIEEGQLQFTHPLEKRVTYHDPCHLGRAAGVFDAPRQVMRAIPGLELVEMNRIYEYSRCCGAGGGVKAGFPEIQTKMSLKRIQEAESVGADELISACPFCYAGLQVGITAMGSSLKMKDVTSLVTESLFGCDIFEKAAQEAAAKAEEKAAKRAARAKAKAEKAALRAKSKS